MFLCLLIGLNISNPAGLYGQNLLHFEKAPTVLTTHFPNSKNVEIRARDGNISSEADTPLPKAAV